MKLFENIKKFFVKHQSDLKNVGIVASIVILMGAVMALVLFTGIPSKKVSEKYNPLYVHTCMHTLKYNSAKLELVKEVDNYIKKVAPQSSLDGYVVVEECLSNGIDICFVLAQGEQESHFGTAGLARRTNSVFNVYAFDGQSHEEINEKGKYKHPNYSVAPYIELLKKDYLVDNKTEYDLMDGQYVNKNGARYASAENYEKMLLDKYTKIRTNTNIDSLCQETNKFKLFLGI